MEFRNAKNGKKVELRKSQRRKMLLKAISIGKISTRPKSMMNIVVKAIKTMVPSEFLDGVIRADYLRL